MNYRDVELEEKGNNYDIEPSSIGNEGNYGGD